jgi:hypothetical protein
MILFASDVVGTVRGARRQQGLKKIGRVSDIGTDQR